MFYENRNMFLNNFALCSNLGIILAPENHQTFIDSLGILLLCFVKYLSNQMVSSFFVFMYQAKYKIEIMAGILLNKKYFSLRLIFTL